MKRFFFFLFLPIFLFGFSIPQASAIPEKIYKALDLFTKVLYIVERDYVEEVDGQDLVYGAIKGMLGTLDPYSVFLTPDIYKELKVDTVGRFGGVGLEITLEKGILTVVSPIEDTPAARAGIHPGDRIVKINGKSTKGMNLADAVRRMRGHRKSKVTLTIYREGIKKPFDVTLKRETIKIKSVKAEMLPDNIAYIRLTSFQEKTSEELQKVIKSFEKKPGGIKAFILDVRNNPGGLLEEAVIISDLFLKSGTIVSTKGRQGVLDVRKASGNGPYFDRPIVILVNRGSASASEIVAGALRDNHRAKIIGTKSFGKGSVQTVIELGEGTGLKITIAKYYTPSGESISGKGIEPDFVIELPEGQAPFVYGKEKDDFQRDTAITYLKTGKIPESPTPKKKEEAKKDDLPEEEMIE